MNTHRFSRFRFVASLFALTLSLIMILQACTTSDTTPSSAPTSGDFAERMEKEHQGDKPIATEIASQQPAVAVSSKNVDYATVDGQTVQGFLTQPANVDKPLPGIIAIHEWWGLNDNIKAVSERLAGEGYSVLAVDLYGGQVVDQPAEAKQLLQSVMDNPDPAKENLRQAYEYLVQEQKAPRIGSIGWCFGGAWSLNTGLLLPEKLNALVIYYGRLQTDPEILAPLQMPIAGFFGGQDQGIPVKDVKAFESALTGLNKTAEIHIYDDADHAFANPSGKRYNPEAAQDAWEKTITFLAKNLVG